MATDAAVQAFLDRVEHPVRCAGSGLLAAQARDDDLPEASAR